MSKNLNVSFTQFLKKRLDNGGDAEEIKNLLRTLNTAATDDTLDSSFLTLIIKSLSTSLGIDSSNAGELSESIMDSALNLEETFKELGLSEDEEDQMDEVKRIALAFSEALEAAGLGDKESIAQKKKLMDIAKKARDAGNFFTVENVESFSQDNFPEYVPENDAEREELADLNETVKGITGENACAILNANRILLAMDTFDTVKLLMAQALAAQKVIAALNIISEKVLMDNAKLEGVELTRKEAKDMVELLVEQSVKVSL